MSTRSSRAHRRDRWSHTSGRRVRELVEHLLARIGEASRICVPGGIGGEVHRPDREIVEHGLSPSPTRREPGHPRATEGSSTRSPGACDARGRARSPQEGPSSGRNAQGRRMCPWSPARAWPSGSGPPAVLRGSARGPLEDRDRAQRSARAGSRQPATRAETASKDSGWRWATS